MKFAQVIGKVVCSQRDPGLEGVKLLVLEQLSAQLKPQGLRYVAADGVGQAGYGDIVAVVFKGDAPEAFVRDRMPLDASIIGIVDPAAVACLRG